MSKIKTIRDVVDWRLCLGCGACSYITSNRIKMVNVPSEGIRPQTTEVSPQDNALGLSVCPGVGVDCRHLAQREGIIPDVLQSFGPVLEIWEGFATDPEIRFLGSSGGALTALSLYALEQANMSGVLHIGQDPVDATLNQTRLSRTRAQLIECTGSRYAPASVCSRLDLVETSERPCVVIGQPSEVSALRKVERAKPELSSKIGMVMSFFCAGSPSQEGTLELLKNFGVESKGLKEIRYRGRGWPGMFATESAGETALKDHIRYEDAWAFLQKFRPYSTHLYPDGSGDEADITCGDPWHRPVQPGEHGSSLIIIRTKRAKAFFKDAMTKGYITAQPATVEQMNRSQGYLTAKRGAVWGRIVAFKMVGAPTPKFEGYHLFSNWMRLSLSEKGKSVVGTLKRVIQRGYNKPKHQGLQKGTVTTPEE